MKKIALLTIVLILCLNCNVKENLTGVWYRVDSDCVYHEIHINKNQLIMCNSATGGCGYMYDISLKKDSLTLSYKDQRENMISYKINNDSLVIIDNDNQKVYHKLDSAFNYFEIENSKIDSFEYRFILRAQKAKAEDTINCKN